MAETGATKLATLRLVRGHLKTSLANLVKYIENIDERVTLDDLRVRLTKALALWDKFDKSQTSFYEFAAEKGYVDPASDYEEFETRFFTVQSFLLSSIREREFAEKNKDIVGQLAEQQKLFMDTLGKTRVCETKAEFFYPKIHIEPFSGNYHEWPSFRDIFQSAIHEKPNLSPVQKFLFLKSSLRGSALGLLNYLPITNAAYEEAWFRLEKRYERPRFIINGYIKAFMELPPAINSNVNQLRKIANSADEIVRGLTAINSLDRDPWIIFILLNKLDPETRKAWSEESSTTDHPKVDDFFEFLESRCDSLESVHTGFSETRSQRKPGVKSMHVSSPSCTKCNGLHGLPQCPDFLKMQVNLRRDFVKSSKLCFNCLRVGHSSNRCSSKFRCSVCKSRHHSLVHDESVYVKRNDHYSVGTSATNLGNDGPIRVFKPQELVPSPPATSNATFVNNHSLNISHYVPQTLLPTAIGKIRDIHGAYQEVRILIDSGSQVSFITESCVQRLGLKRRNVSIPISGIGFTDAGKSRGLLSIVISSRIDLSSIFVNTYILSSVTSNLPTSSFSVDDWAHVKNLELADPSFNQSSGVDILLGADKVWEVLTGSVVYGKQGQPIAQKTIFGWVLAGQLSVSNTCIVSYPATLNIDSLLQAFWTVEEVDSKSIVSKENQAIEEHFVRTHTRDPNGKYIVDLPFKLAPNFKNTFYGAFSRLKSVERKFASNKSFFENYCTFLKEYLALGHMAKVPEGEINNPNVYYLPHHAVLKPDSKSTKLRVVFDGSFQDSNGTCLNDSLMIGPPIQRNLFSVCLRFRRHKFVFSADIVKMFRQIWVSEKDSDFQRILWRESPSEPLEHFRLRTVTYGTSCAPYLSVRILQQLAMDYAIEFPVAADVVLNDFYVDDVVSGADTLEEALLKQNSLIELLSKCGMELSKWQSNCQELLRNTDNSGNNVNISLDSDSDSYAKVLGLYWNTQSDLFTFRLNYVPNEPITKRQILRDVARIFDPLGFLAPSIVLLKILFQELWLNKLEWDEELPVLLSSRWINYRTELSFLTKINVSREIGIGNPEFQLHAFSDASASAYAAVIYARYQLPNGNYITNIVAAKSRVAPVKQLSIPRLELCGAVLLTRLLVSVQQALNITFADVYAWTDSKVVLSWLSSHPRRWNIFIGNRTSEILNNIPRSRWYHVKGECNPADCASRGILPSQLIEHPLWWSGPAWLKKDFNHWPIVVNPEEDPSCSIEERQRQPVSLVITTEDHPYEILSKRISSWNILVRTVAQIIRVVDRCHRKERPSTLLTPQEIFNAKNKIIRWLQDQFFGKDIRHLKNYKSIPKKCKLLDLSPFLDNERLLRVGGRIENASVSFSVKHPIILPKDHIITNLILVDAHNRFLHPGVSTLFALVRQEYWVIGCRNLLRKITHDCIKCFRQRKATITQQMSNLPPQRVHASRPFMHCGCDYAGPLTLKTKLGRKSALTKCYISLFVCLVSKAIHLELVSDLTTDAFLAAFRRFVARRGKPSKIYSDNGTNFHGAARSLSEMHALVLSEHHNSVVAESLARDGISWHFNPPSAPHFGGLWEAGVKSVKQHLRRVIGTDNLTFEELYTLLTQIEAILNSRPLCQMSDSDLDPLTPSHFFLGESYAAVPEPTLDIPQNRLSNWQNLQAKIQGYWKRWNLEYLTSLQNRPKWQNVTKDIKLKDLVVIKETNLPPGKWAMGRVVNLHPGKDGHIRVVTLKTSNGNLVRPIHKLAILPIS